MLRRKFAENFPRNNGSTQFFPSRVLRRKFDRFALSRSPPPRLVLFLPLARSLRSLPWPSLLPTKILESSESPQPQGRQRRREGLESRPYDRRPPPVRHPVRWLLASGARFLLVSFVVVSAGFSFGGGEIGGILARGARGLLENRFLWCASALEAEFPGWFCCDARIQLCFPHGRVAIIVFFQCCVQPHFLRFRGLEFSLSSFGCSQSHSTTLLRS